MITAIARICSFHFFHPQKLQKCKPYLRTSGLCVAESDIRSWAASSWRPLMRARFFKARMPQSSSVPLGDGRTFDGGGEGAARRASALPYPRGAAPRLPPGSARRQELTHRAPAAPTERLAMTTRRSGAGPPGAAGDAARPVFRFRPEGNSSSSSPIRFFCASSSRRKFAVVRAIQHRRLLRHLPVSEGLAAAIGRTKASRACSLLR